ncbi:MAG: hypothetical protein ACLPYY_08355 [Acidimicrobiales bacterium]
MPSDRTMVTELGTGLGMLGLPGIDEAVRARPPVMHSLSPELWERLAALRAGGGYDAEFHAAWSNGQAFLAADDGLRGRLPKVLEWKGTGRAPGDEVAPIDLRVDHVYLVSCKYLSKILFNVSPGHVFDGLLVGGSGRGTRTRGGGLAGTGDWYAEVAPAEYQALYETVRRVAVDWDGAASAPQAVVPPRPRERPDRAPTAPALPGLGTVGTVDAAAAPGSVSGSGLDVGSTGAVPGLLRVLPPRAVDLSSHQRDALGRWLGAGWPADAKARYATLSHAVARASVRRWEAAMDGGAGAGEAMLWRLLRIGSAPYFVLGSSAARSLRLRIATSWDWRRQYKLVSFALEPQPGGQPRVGWEATVRERVSHDLHAVAGHIEVRWSHGRFGGLPEAKGYLDTPHHLVPGYVTLR